MSGEFTTTAQVVRIRLKVEFPAEAEPTIVESDVQWNCGEPRVLTAKDLPKKRALPLLAFLALYKLTGQGATNGQPACGGSRTWVSCLFSERRGSAHVDSLVGKIFSMQNRVGIWRNSFEDAVMMRRNNRGSFFAYFACPAPRREEIRIVDGDVEIATPDQVRDFLKRLATFDPSLLHQPLGGHEPAALRATQEVVGRLERPSTGDFAGIQIFDSTDSALDRFRRECEARFPGPTERRLSPFEIRWLALGMAGASRTMENVLRRLVRAETDREIRFFIAMIDPNWEDLPRVSETWSNSAAANHDNFVRFLTGFSTQTAEQSIPKVTVNIWKYSYVPNWVGVVVEDSVYCVTSCFCRKAIVSGNVRMYVDGNVDDLMLIDATGETALIDGAIHGTFARKIAKVFDRWFSFACHGPFSTGPETIVLGEANEAPRAKRPRLPQ
jgi:hypothetical protein